MISTKQLYLIFAIIPCIVCECQPPKKLITFEEWHPKDSKDGGGYFTPIALQNDTNIVKEMLQGSSLNPDQDLKKICIRLHYSDDGKNMSIGAGNVTSQFKCTPIGDGKDWSFDCKHENGKEEYNHKMFASLTDKKTFAFIIRCWKSGLRGWTVLSTRKELHEDSQFHILEHAKSQGFETAIALPLSYKSCRN